MTNEIWCIEVEKVAAIFKMAEQNQTVDFETKIRVNVAMSLLTEKLTRDDDL